MAKLFTPPGTNRGDVVKFEIQGLDAFREAVKAIPKEVRKQLAGAVGEVADMIRSRAAAGAPVDLGDLSRNVIVIGRKTSMTRRVGVRDVDLASRGSRNTFHRNPGVYGMKAVEFPMRKRRRADGGQVRSYRPFLRPALAAAQAWYPAALLRRGPAIEAALAAHNRGGTGT